MCSSCGNHSRDISIWSDNWSGNVFWYLSKKGCKIFFFTGDTCYRRSWFINRSGCRNHRYEWIIISGNFNGISKFISGWLGILALVIAINFKGEISLVWNLLLGNWTHNLEHWLWTRSESFLSFIYFSSFL